MISNHQVDAHLARVHGALAQQPPVDPLEHLPAARVALPPQVRPAFLVTTLLAATPSPHQQLPRTRARSRCVQPHAAAAHPPAWGSGALAPAAAPRRAGGAPAAARPPGAAWCRCARGGRGCGAAPPRRQAQAAAGRCRQLLWRSKTRRRERRRRWRRRRRRRRRPSCRRWRRRRRRRRRPSCRRLQLPLGISGRPGGQPRAAGRPGAWQGAGSSLGSGLDSRGGRWPRAAFSETCLMVGVSPL